MTRLFSRIAALLFVLTFIAGPAVAVEENLQITATAATTDQLSGTITRPPYPPAAGLIVIVDVTAGVTLLLDVNLQIYVPSKDTWYNWAINCGSFTAIGTYACAYVPKGNIAHYVIVEEGVMVPSEFRILIDHGNANAATYNVYTQWVR